MFETLAQARDWVRDQYTHGVTTALGVGWLTQAADLGSKLLGLAAIGIGIYCSLDKLRRDRQIHAQRMEAERVALISLKFPGLKVFEPAPNGEAPR